MLIIRFLLRFTFLGGSDKIRAARLGGECPASLYSGYIRGASFRTLVLAAGSPLCYYGRESNENSNFLKTVLSDRDGQNQATCPTMTLPAKVPHAAGGVCAALT